MKSSPQGGPRSRAAMLGVLERYTNALLKPPVMSEHDDLLEKSAPDESPFADKGTPDPLADPEQIHARDAQERDLATLLDGHPRRLSPADGLDLRAAGRGRRWRGGARPEGSPNGRTTLPSST